MAMKFTTTAQASKLNGVKVLAYSDAGLGKTTLCATAPKPCIISAESGLLSLRPENIARLEQVVQRSLPRDFPVMEITSYNDLVDAYTFASSQHGAQFETFCLDSLSEIAERVLTNAKKVAKDPRQAYGALIDDTLAVVRAFRDLPGKNVYFSAKQERVTDANGVAMFGPSMPGKQLGPGLPYFFDEVFHLGVAKDAQGRSYRYLRTSPDFQYTAKDRSGALAEIERPDLSYIFNKIAGV